MSAHAIVLTDSDTIEPKVAVSVGLTDAEPEPLVWLNFGRLHEDTASLALDEVTCISVHADDLLGALSLLSDEWRFTRVPVVTEAPVEGLVMERCHREGTPSLLAGAPCESWHHFTPDLPETVSGEHPRWYHCPPGGTP